MDPCCPNHFTGFCLEDGTPIILVIHDNVQTGWINIETGVFTLGAPPAGTTLCGNEPAPRFLDCDTDSVTICQPTVTSAVTNVAGTTSNVTLLAANANRKGAILYNDSSNACYVKFGATASATSFTIKMLSQTYYELVKGYVGIIDGVWQNSANGAMRITEFM